MCGPRRGNRTRAHSHQPGCHASEGRAVESLPGLRGLRPPALLGCGLLRGSLIALLPAPALTLGTGARLVGALDRDDTEAVRGRLRPLLLLAVLVGVRTRLLRARDGDDGPLYERGILGVATKQRHAVERDPRVLPLVRVLVERTEVLCDGETRSGLAVVPVLNLGVCGESSLKCDLSHT